MPKVQLTTFEFITKTWGGSGRPRGFSRNCVDGEVWKIHQVEVFQVPPRYHHDYLVRGIEQTSTDYTH